MVYIFPDEVHGGMSREQRYHQGTSTTKSGFHSGAPTHRPHHHPHPTDNGGCVQSILNVLTPRASRCSLVQTARQHNTARRSAGVPLSLPSNPALPAQSNASNNKHQIILPPLRLVSPLSHLVTHRPSPRLTQRGGTLVAENPSVL